MMSNSVAQHGNWYPDPYGQPLKRFHDGQQWTAHTAPIHPTQQQPAPQPGPSQIVALNIGGRSGCNHALHAVLTIFTAGLWLPVWLICWAVGSGRRGGSINIR